MHSNRASDSVCRYQRSSHQPPPLKPLPATLTSLPEDNYRKTSGLTLNTTCRYRFLIERANSLSTVQSDIKWNSMDNLYLQEDVWNENSRSVTTRFCCPLAVIDTPGGASKTIDATIHVAAGARFDSKVLSCKLKIGPSSRSE